MKGLLITKEVIKDYTYLFVNYSLIYLFNLKDILIERTDLWYLYYKNAITKMLFIMK